MIVIRKLNKTYHNNKQALKDIDLTINAGEIFGIIGKSGAGKSTFLRTINLLEQPSSGSITINNVSITKLPPKSLRQFRRNIGFIFQNFNLLYSKDVFANIALPLKLAGTKKPEITKRVTELLTLVDLSEYKDYLPENLSGGQKQRVAIARALATNPEILLCDEVTSSLDSESTRNILNLLTQINTQLGKTIVLITHELDVVKSICDRTGVFSNGELIEVNQTQELFANPKQEQTKRLIIDSRISN